MIKRVMTFAVLMLALAACSGLSNQTSGSANDPQSAQRLLPTISGFTSTDARNITDALSAVGGSASLVTGNPLIAGAIAEIDSVMSCLQNVGGMAARIYTQNDITTLLQGQVPVIGALAVVNEDRVRENLLACALPGNNGAFSAQSAGTIQPCSGSGTTTVAGDTIHYVYVATNQSLCSTFQASFPAQ